jgi:hypothetical protein
MLAVFSFGWVKTKPDGRNGNPINSAIYDIFNGGHE